MQIQTHGKPTQRKVRLSEITCRPEAFQFRHLETDEYHVRTLAEVPAGGNTLDPIAVWADPDSGELIVIDGHHRLAAYRQVQWSRKVPVRVHQCSLEDARLLALKENGKTRLPLTQQERSDAAWRLVCLGPRTYSKRVTAQVTGVSERTVANMRKTYELLIKLAGGDDLLPTSWVAALSEASGRERRDFTEEERTAMIDEKTRQLDDKIGKALGFMASHQPEAAVQVVASRLGRQGLRLLFEEYGGEIGLDDGDPYGECSPF
ncbi:MULTISPECIES: ParB/RepB/Spo0J family partition protein [Mameliella]|uniref:ParB/RepB/Spo0J family partition protein n=1 Tax=Mameliella TaxID=1434019 RepID=UPI000B530D6A|nr:MULTISPECIES: ParB/RepB/Spo0J family partition protein [Mameliella]MCR9276178.1 ParB/RepB/Spo0J family partition protein [Paracoccaceae bacterium]OWV62934.1 chromosome partitioning protein ParB [Mameliella alba]